MSQVVISIDESHLENTSKLLKKYSIPFRILGYPNGTVQVVESFPSKLNVHADLNKFAIQLGYKSTVDAIKNIGSGREFRNKFNKEFNK